MDIPLLKIPLYKWYFSHVGRHCQYWVISKRKSFFSVCVIPWKWAVTFVGSVQSLSHVRLFVTPWITAHQASLSINNSQSLLKTCLLSRWCYPAISSSVFPFSSCFQSFPASESFPMSQFFASGGQCIGVSVSASVLPMNIQNWFPLGWTGWISLQSKGLSRGFSNTTVQKHQFFSYLYSPTLTSIHDYWKNHSFDYMDLWQQRPLSLFSFFQPVIISTKKKWSSCDMIEVLLLYNGNHITIYSCIKVTCYIP